MGNYPHMSTDYILKTNEEESEDLGLNTRRILVPSFLQAISHCFHFPAVDRGESVGITMIVQCNVPPGGEVDLDNGYDDDNDDDERRWVAMTRRWKHASPDSPTRQAHGCIPLPLVLTATSLHAFLFDSLLLNPTTTTTTRSPPKRQQQLSSCNSK
jgi:hypothetical protein